MCLYSLIGNIFTLLLLLVATSDSSTDEFLVVVGLSVALRGGQPGSCIIASTRKRSEPRTFFNKKYSQGPTAVTDFLFPVGILAYDTTTTSTTRAARSAVRRPTTSSY